jgi:hypothetical protein
MDVGCGMAVAVAVPTCRTENCLVPFATRPLSGFVLSCVKGVLHCPESRNSVRPETMRRQCDEGGSQRGVWFQTLSWTTGGRYEEEKGGLKGFN